MDEIARPEGVEPKHIHEAGGSRIQTWPVGVLGLGVLLAASVFGVFGAEPQLTAASGGLELTVAGPERIRNGELFEMVVTVEPDREVEELVILVGADTWRDVTVNSFVPAAVEEGYRDGTFAFSFGAVEAGAPFVMKVDGQVNPDHSLSANRGEIVVADGDDRLAAVDYVMEVLP